MPLALIISPIRSWPEDQGNRARIRAFGRMFQERGYTVHFLLSCLEGDPSEEEIEEMRGQWEQVHIVPYQHQRRRKFADAWGADDWFDPSTYTVAKQLCCRWNYDLCVINYAWYSKALDALPPECVRIIDTHDAFGDRHKRLYEAGTSPEWYFTRAREEARSLRRSDFIIAIQDEEAAWFRKLSRKTVHTVGHVASPNYLPVRPRDGKPRAAYLASGNPSNRQSLALLIAEWKKNPTLVEEAELHVAGSVCAAVDSAPGAFLTLHGFIRDPAEFYENADFSVNPNVGGSGLKIKSIEALSFGLPLFSTVEGMLGICGARPPYVVPDVASLVASLARQLKADPGLSRARSWSQETYLTYRSHNIAAFEAMLREAENLRAARLSQKRNLA